MRKDMITDQIDLGKKYKTVLAGNLLRIYAIKSFGEVKDGEMGGLIESESNLSHDGDCWIDENAKVYGNAKVYHNAQIFGNAEIYNNAEVYGNAEIFGNAEVFGNAQVYDNAKVYHNAEIFGNAEIFDNFSINDAVRLATKDAAFSYSNNSLVWPVIKDYKS